MNKKYYTFIVDGTKFNLLKPTLNKFSETTIYKTINRLQCDDPRIHIAEDDTMYIDADLDSFKCIISFMRGYQITDINMNLMRKVYYDAVHFNITELTAILEQLNLQSEVDNNKRLTDTLVRTTKNDNKSSSLASPYELSDSDRKKMKNLFNEI